ncbi:MAG: response regulator transcription factor [Proteobacteria bacterium]|nr:response regulator transcription factor [Pseudomonadota bacterium]MBU1685887.1 response regulator transcription factor [Pseudomonadota bacterium]
MTSLLIIDDDTELCELLADYLGREGFQIAAVHNGTDGVTQTLTEEYDLIVLDVMLPGLNGFDVLRKIRLGSMVPVLMLTARGDDVDRIVGLELGADDYLPKPFNPRELVARIRAIQRRIGSTREGSSVSPETFSGTITVGDVTLNPATHTVHRDESQVELTAVEFSLLHYLLKKAGQVVPRDELAEKVLGRKLELFDRSIDVHISSLRKKLGSRPGGRDRIISVRGVGYQYPFEESGS